jgi:hypothetical protein
MEERQLFRDLAPEPTATPLIIAEPSHCSVFALPIGGVITMPNGEVVTLTAPAVYRPTCTPVTQPAIIANGGGGTLTVDQTAADDNTITDLPTRDPFYASTFPQCYALAATTVIAYTLVIMLFITPRSFLDGGVVVLGRRGFTNGGTGGTNIGGRPWLQKVAALTVAISLTIATSNTFKVAEDQYQDGYQNAELIQSEVLGGTELKVIRIISDTFLWLAQAQTLIRLFPRQREKIIIKWTAFALITFDLIFQCLNSFIYTNQGNVRPRNFTDAVPALSYLFQLSLGVLYAAWVIYYSLMKKRYAFYHQQMKNICLVAVMSVMAILVPVVFFILDICKPEFTGWGDYVRWVGAAAASVIVWEWVERIEALEREEKKDGILGREVFDGDEMLDMMPSDQTWPRRRKTGKSSGSDDGEAGTRSQTQTASSGRGTMWPTVSSIATRYRSKSRPRGAEQPADPNSTQPSNHDRIRFLQPPLWPSRPPPAVTPVSRTDTPSAASTVYAVRYRPLTETTSRTPEPLPGQTIPSRSSSPTPSHHSDEDTSGPPVEEAVDIAPGEDKSGGRWRALSQGIPFPRIGRNPSAKEEYVHGRKQIQHQDSSRWDIRTRLEEFAVSQAEKIREKIRPSVDTDSLPVTVVPAPPRRGAALAQLLEERELESLPDRTPTTEQQSTLGTQRRSSGGPASSPTVGDFPASHRQGSILAASLASRSRPAPSAIPAPETGRNRNPQLSITIIPAPARETSSTQPQSSVLGRQVSDDEARD